MILIQIIFIKIAKKKLLRSIAITISSSLALVACSKETIPPQIFLSHPDHLRMPSPAPIPNVIPSPHQSTHPSTTTGERSIIPSLPFHDRVADPCLITNLDTLSRPIVNRVFEGNNALYDNFKRDFLENRAHALKAWLHSTATFTDISSSADDIQLTVLREDIRPYTGIYEVQVISHPERNYILKLSRSDDELNALWKLQNSLIGHPECFETHTPLEVGTPIPKIATVYEASTFSLNRHLPDSFRRTRRYRLSDFLDSQDLYLILMEKLSGTPLLELLSQEPNLSLHDYQRIGKSLGFFHSSFAVDTSNPVSQWKTVLHGDGEFKNLIFDTTTGNISFLDPAWLDYSRHFRANPGPFLKIEDFFDTFLPYGTLTEGVDLRPNYLRRIIDPYIEHWIQSPSGTLLGNPTDIALIQNSENYRVFQRSWSRFRGFIQGYIEGFPENRRNEVRQEIGQRCRLAHRAYIPYESSGPIPRYFLGNVERQNILYAALRRIYPPEFLACLDENRFD